jgi:predicted nucleic-acid-binding protein
MAKNEISLPDTNVIIRYLLKDIPDQYEESAGFFESVRNGSKSAVILESVLVECVYILVKFYKAPKSEVVASLTGLLRYKGVVNRDKDAMVEALRVFSENNLDVVDCVLIAKGNYDGMTLFTFDKALGKVLLAEKNCAVSG